MYFFETRPFNAINAIREKIRRAGLVALDVFCLSFLLSMALENQWRASAGETSKPHDLSKQIELAKTIAASELVRNGVLKHNSELSAEHKELTNLSWKHLGATDRKVKDLAENPIAKFLKDSFPKYVTEVFVSGKDGKKVAFTRRTTSWDHTGKDKHEIPMKNTVWQGSIERDESTGVHQIQIAVPVFHEGSAIGSMVVGISIVNLERSQGTKP